MNISNEQNKAAGEIVDLIAGSVGANREIHPETAIASCANLAGSLMLRSFNFDLTKDQGSVLLSNEANEKYPQLINILSAVLERSEVSLDKSKLGGEVSKRGAQPKLTIQQALELLQGKALEIAKRNNLSLEEMSISAALATAFVVKESARNIGYEIGFNVAAYGFIEGIKTVPPSLESGEKPAPLKNEKPWYKFW